MLTPDAPSEGTDIKKRAAKSASARTNAKSAKISGLSHRRVARASSHAHRPSMETAQPHEEAEAKNNAGSHGDDQNLTATTLCSKSPVYTITTPAIGIPASFAAKASLLACAPSTKIASAKAREMHPTIRESAKAPIETRLVVG